MKEAFVTIITVPFALIGGFYGLLYDINLSVAVAVGFIALFGLAIETAMLITIYLNEAMVKMVEKHGNSRDTNGRYFTRTIILALQEVASQVNDGFCCFVWISTYLWSTGTGLM
jgi:Cu(I)/Ag(I) efflux system membrane protein CusA/SilA